MSLACLVCHNSFRSYSVSSSDNEGRCSSMASCLNRIPPHRGGGNPSVMASSKVSPQPNSMPENGADNPGPPRLVRSHAVRRDIVRDWNFDQVEIVGQ